MADDLLQRAREHYQKRHHGLAPDWVAKLMVDFARAENARLTEQLAEADVIVDLITSGALDSGCSAGVKAFVNEYRTRYPKLGGEK